MLSFASEADIPPRTFLSRGGDDADACVDSEGGAGDTALGFHVAPPAGLGRGTGAGPAGAAGLFSNAAILSRKEPTFGLVGGGSDIEGLEDRCVQGKKRVSLLGTSLRL